MTPRTGPARTTPMRPLASILRVSLGTDRSVALQLALDPDKVGFIPALDLTQGLEVTCDGVEYEPDLLEGPEPEWAAPSRGGDDGHGRS